MISRRKLLLGTAGSFLAFHLLGAKNALADSSSNGPKYLVCVFLFGGMDAFDTVIMTNSPHADNLKLYRQDILDGYENSRDPAPAPGDDPNMLEHLNWTDGDENQFSLPYELKELAEMFNGGDAAIIANVGPLTEITNSQNFESVRPSQLFSHNDQQATWMTFDTEGRGTGWGGEFIEKIGHQKFSAIDFVGGHGFLNTNVNIPFAANTNLDFGINFLQGTTNSDDAITINDDAKIKAHNYWTLEYLNHPEIIKKDLSLSLARGIKDNDLLGAINFSSAGYNVQTGSQLGPQLDAVSRMIKAGSGSAVLPDKQVFFVGLGSFDTHKNQADDLAALQADLSQSLGEFKRVLEVETLWDNVIVFTASDFGRSLMANSNKGTDHGWGGHHFVMGGCVNGGKIFGQMPEPDLSKDYYTETGRLIPTFPLQHYVHELGSWLGVTKGQLEEIIPYPDDDPNHFGPIENIIS